MSRDSRLVAIIFFVNLFIGLGYMSDTGRFIPPVFTDHLLLLIVSVVFAARTRGMLFNRILLIVPAVFFFFYAFQAKETQLLIGEFLEMDGLQNFLKTNHTVFKWGAKVSGIATLLMYFVWMIDILVRIRKPTRYIPLLTALLAAPLLWVNVQETVVFIAFTVLSVILLAVFIARSELNDADKRFSLLIILVGLISLINLIFFLTVA